MKLNSQTNIILKSKIKKNQLKNEENKIPESTELTFQTRDQGCETRITL